MMTECVEKQKNLSDFAASSKSWQKQARGQLIVFSAPSGCGKDTVLRHLLKKNDNIHLSISATTRSPRDGEQDGKDYFFITKSAFEDGIKDGRMLEWAEYCHEYYGTPRDVVDYYRNMGKDVILEIEVKGALMIKQNIPDAVFVFLMPPSLQELKARLINRGTESMEKIEKRLKKGVQEMEQAGEYTYVVFNYDAEKAAELLECIITSEKCKYTNNTYAIGKVMDNNA